ncbi:glycine--tRNA ligase [Candidatus Micrarchaeota archaeon]|nr:glycine--tRNA ligase [Candidatus Micrarchaeota archaeon]
MFEKIMELALKRGFLIQSAEVYNAPAGFYDFGPVGTALKRKIQEAWRNQFIRREGNLEIETCAILPEIVLKASGHVGCFADPLVECIKCAKKHRADELIRNYLGKNKEELKKKNPKALELKTEGMNAEQLTKTITELGITCECGGKLNEAKPFNLMFKTNIGAAEGNTAYTRPETAQGIFLDFQRVFKAHGAKLPMGIAQIGRSFRNEISPRQGLLRLREFTQMELEYFFDPQNQKHLKFKEVENEEIKLYTREEQMKNSEKETRITARELVEKKIVPNEIMAYFLVREKQFYDAMGVKKHRIRHMLAEETPHYSGGNFDVEVETSYGWIETVGTAYRTDYDLKSHAQASKKELSVFIEERKEKIIPHVVEPSFGVDRLFWCVLEAAYRQANKEQGKEWDWFDFPTSISPIDVAVFPLMKKDGMPEKAREIEKTLREEGLDVLYDESGSVGKRYARMDEVGTPYCITVDYETKETGEVTIRFRNDGKQIKVKISEIARTIKKCIKEGKVSV